MGDFPKFGHILVIACNSICMHGPTCGIYRSSCVKYARIVGCMECYVGHKEYLKLMEFNSMNII